MESTVQEEKLAILQQDYETLREKYDARKQQIDRLYEQEQQLALALEQQQEAVAKLKQERSIEKAQHTAAIDRVTEELEALRTQYDAINEELTLAKEQMKQQQDALDEERESLIEVQQMLAEEQAAFAELKADLSLEDAAQLKGELSRLQQKYERVVVFSKNVQEQVQQQRELQSYIEELTEKNAALESEVARCEELIKLYQQGEVDWAHIKKVKSDYSFLKQQYDTLQQLYHEQQMDMEQARAELLHMRQQAERAITAENRSAFYEIRLRSLEAELKRLQQKEKDAIADESRMFESFQLLIEKSAKTSPSIAKYPGDKVAYERIVTAAQQGNYEFSHAMVQGFLAAMRSTRFIILKGLSGTGKTSLPKIVAHALGGVCEVVAVQPNWKSKTDLVGFYNHFNDRFMATQFTEELLKAQLPENKDKFYFIVLDEMNLARVEYYFSDFNSKLELEENKQLVELFDTVGRTSGALADYVIDGNKLRIPPNVFFIGTINEDESTYTLSDKIYDRAQVLDFQAAISEKTGDIAAIEPMPTVSFSDFKREQTTVQKQSVTTMMRVIEDVLHVLSERLFIEVGNRPRRHMRAFLQTYAANNWSEQDAVDLQIVSKVVPKIIPSYDEEFELAMDEVIRIAQHNSAASQAVRAIEKVKRHAK